MPFSALTSAQQILIKLYMLGGPQFKRDMVESGLATKKAAGYTKSMEKAMKGVTTQSFLMRQALFTARRVLFYFTLAAVGAGAAVARMGFTYLNALQSATVALRPVLKDQRSLNNELDFLWVLAARTPFQFQDVTEAFRKMYAGFRDVGISVKDTNDTITAVTDALAYAGKVTPAALNKISVQLQHMAFIGRPTGQVMLALARDGLPVYPALRKELHLTGDEIRNIGASSLTTLQVIRALNRYVRTTQGFSNAAIRIQSQTLVGAWATFKDLLSQAAGQALGGASGKRGIFGFLQQTLIGVNQQLALLYEHRKPVTLTAIAEAFDKQLSPQSHAIINTFIFFEYVLKGLFGTFLVIYNIVNFFAKALGRLTSVFGLNIRAAKYLGIAIGILSALFLWNRTLMLLEILAVEAFAVAMYALRGAIIGLTLAIRFLNIAWIAFNLLLLISAANPVIAVLILISIILLVLYLKWKKFHELIVNAFKWIMDHKIIVAAALSAMFAPIVAALGTLLAIVRAIQWIIDHSKHIEQIAKSAAKKTHTSINLGTPLPFHQHGGNVVGPIGTPQLIVAHGGERVVPIGEAQWDRGNDKPILVQVMLDRKVLAQGVARAKQDYDARR